MNSLRTDVDDFRLERKCSTNAMRLLFPVAVLFLLASHVSCRPSTDEFDSSVDKHVNAAADNIEWHRVKVVDGVMQSEEHPVIFYKEDYVSEDYVPAKNKHKNSTSSHRSRKHKEISRRHRYNRTEAENYHALKPEKIYFDVLPVAPVVVADDSSAIDSKFDPSKIRVEILSLVDDSSANESGDEPSKQALSKTPKKYRHRQRRDTGIVSGGTHSVFKRTPSYTPTDFNSLLNLFQNIGVIRQQPNPIRHPVKGIYHNAISPPGPQPGKQAVGLETRFGGENETDRVVWGSSKANRVTTQRPVPPLFHDPSPENWDTSFLSPARQPASTTQRPVPPLFHDSDPANWDTSFLNGQNIRAQASAPAEQPPAPPEEEPVKVSQCVWAIVSCCSRQNQNIRNDCFEAMNCGRNFWGLNPCSESIQDKAVLHVDKFLD